MSELNVSICDGKYTVIQEPTGETRVLRYGEEWRDVTGDNVIGGLAWELQESRKRIKLMKESLSRVARIAHNGGLVSLSHLDAWTIVRRITVPYWSPSEKNERHCILLTEEISNHIKECKKAIKAKP